jgi:hypothetical protein
LIFLVFWGFHGLEKNPPRLPRRVSLYDPAKKEETIRETA